jgi:hypothetical protein
MIEEQKPGIVSRVLNTVEAAIAKVTATKQAEAAAAQATEEQNRREYRQVMCRAETNPKSSDAARLEELIGVLNLDTATVRKDAEFVAGMLAAINLAAQEDQRCAAHSAAHEKLRKTKERHAEELKAAESELNKASGERSRSHYAGQEVVKAYAKRPEWFEDPSCLKFPANLKKPEPPAPPPPERKCAKVQIDMGNDGTGKYFVEPVVGEDGLYIRNAQGKYLMPGGVYSP